MGLKALFCRIAGFIKRLLGRETPESDELGRIVLTAEKIINNFNLSRVARCHVTASAIALRHLRRIKECAEAMMGTTEPDFYISKYHDALLFAERAAAETEADKSLCEGIRTVEERLRELAALPECAAEDGLVYYSVTFGSRRKEYYYLSGGKAYKAGQYVLVPVGQDMEHKIARVTSFHSFTPTNAPMEPELLKTIIAPAAAE